MFRLLPIKLFSFLYTISCCSVDLLLQSIHFVCLFPPPSLFHFYSPSFLPTHRKCQSSILPPFRYKNLFSFNIRKKMTDFSSSSPFALQSSERACVCIFYRTIWLKRLPLITIKGSLFSEHSCKKITRHTLNMCPLFGASKFQPL